MWVLTLLSVVFSAVVGVTFMASILSCAQQNEVVKVDEPKSLKQKYGSTMDLVSFAKKLSTSQELSVEAQLSSGDIFENKGGLSSANTMSINLNPIETEQDKFIVTVMLKNGYQFQNPQNREAPGIWSSSPQTYQKKVEVFWPENLLSYESELTLDKYIDEINRLPLEEKLMPGKIFRDLPNLSTEVVKDVVLVKTNETQFTIRLWLNEGFEFGKLSFSERQHASYRESDPITYKVLDGLEKNSEPTPAVNANVEIVVEQMQEIVIDPPKAFNQRETALSADEYVREVNAKSLAEKLEPGYLFEDLGGVSLENTESINLVSTSANSVKIEILLKEGYLFSCCEEDLQLETKLESKGSELAAQHETNVVDEVIASTPEPVQKVDSPKIEQILPIEQVIPIDSLAPKSEPQNEVTHQEPTRQETAPEPTPNPFEGRTVVEVPECLDAYESYETFENYVAKINRATVEEKLVPFRLFKKVGKGMTKETVKRIWLEKNGNNSFRVFVLLKDGYIFNNSTPTHKWVSHGSFAYKYKQLNRKPWTESTNPNAKKQILGVPEAVKYYTSPISLEEFKRNFDNESIEQKLRSGYLLRKNGGLTSQSVKAIEMSLFVENLFKLKVWLNDGYAFDNSYKTFGRHSSYWESKLMTYRKVVLVPEPQTIKKKIETNKSLAEYIRTFNSAMRFAVQYQITTEFVSNLNPQQIGRIELLPDESGNHMIFRITAKPEYAFAKQGETTWLSEKISHSTFS